MILLIISICHHLQNGAIIILIKNIFALKKRGKEIRPKILELLSHSFVIPKLMKKGDK